MEPQVQMFNGRVYVLVPDHIEDVVVLRNAKSFQFTIPNDERRTIGRKYSDEGIIEPIRD